MADFFDFSEYGLDEEKPVETQVDEGYINSPMLFKDDGLELIGASEPASEIFSEAESRLQRATLYKHFLSGQIFSGTQDSHTREVEAEFRQFAVQKLHELLGLREPPHHTQEGHSQFDDDEVKVLKAVAGRMLQDAKNKAKAKPELIQKPVPQKPERVQITVPEVRVSPKATPRLQLPPSMKAAPAPTLVQAIQKKEPGRSKIPQDGEFVKKNGKTHKVKWREVSENSYPGLENRLAKIPAGQVIKLPNDAVVHRTYGNELYQIIFQDLTTQIQSTGAVPFPTMAQFEMITSMKAAEAVNAISPDTQKILSKM